jgi:hypothetical protein
LGVRGVVSDGAALGRQFNAGLWEIAAFLREVVRPLLEYRDTLLGEMESAAKALAFCIAFACMGTGVVWHQCYSRSARRARQEIELLDRDFPDAFMTREEAEGVVFGGLWVNKVAHAVKVEMGLDFDDTPLNRKNAVRIAKRLMVEWSNNSHRTSHMRRDMRRIILLVFTPDQEEVEVKRLESSWPIWWRRYQVKRPFLSSLFD